MTRCQTVLLALCALAAACSTTSDAAPTAPQAASHQGPQQQCVETMTRSRACTDQYVPALVDARARLDQPRGIDAEAQRDRSGLIAQARSEWAKDSTDDAIAQRCQAIVAHLTPEVEADVSRARRCVAQADCGAFVGCVMPIVERHLPH